MERYEDPFTKKSYGTVNWQGSAAKSSSADEWI